MSRVYSQFSIDPDGILYGRLPDAAAIVVDTQLPVTAKIWWPSDLVFSAFSLEELVEKLSDHGWSCWKDSHGYCGWKDWGLKAGALEEQFNDDVGWMIAGATGRAMGKRLIPFLLDQLNTRNLDQVIITSAGSSQELELYIPGMTPVSVDAARMALIEQASGQEAAWLYCPCKPPYMEEAIYLLYVSKTDEMFGYLQI